MKPVVVLAPDRDLRDARALNGRSSGAKPIPLRDRIIANTVVDDNGCWIWQLTRNKLGYGTMMVGAWYAGKVTCQKPYRIAYREFVGEIPDGLELDHLCRVPACCNPAHLEAVTHRVNTQRGEQGQWQRKKTQCPQGHPYDEANTYLVPGDRWHRRCRACMKAQRSK